MQKHGVDDSHGLMHSMDVLNFAHNIYKSEVDKIPALKSQERLIYVSAIIHDMCDKKYMNETVGIGEIEYFLQGKIDNAEIAAVKDIVGTMSYYTVMKKGFPDLGEFQSAYHIVREADLLSAYNFDRSMIYHMQRSNTDIQVAYQNAFELFENRVLRHEIDGLFTTEYAKQESRILHTGSLRRIQAWRTILKTPHF